MNAYGHNDGNFVALYNHSMSKEHRSSIHESPYPILVSI